MRPKYSKRTVDEAVRLLDVYASQAGWLEGVVWPPMSIWMVACAIGAEDSNDLAQAAWLATPRGVRDSALEAAQRLREGWRP